MLEERHLILGCYLGRAKPKSERQDPTKSEIWVWLGYGSRLDFETRMEFKFGSGSCFGTQVVPESSLNMCICICLYELHTFSKFYFEKETKLKTMGTGPNPTQPKLLLGIKFTIWVGPVQVYFCQQSIWVRFG